MIPQNMASSIQEVEIEEVVQNELYIEVKYSDLGHDFKPISMSPSKLKTYTLIYLIIMNTNEKTDMNSIFTPLIRSILDSSKKSSKYTCGYFKKNDSEDITSFNKLIVYCDNPVKSVNEKCSEHLDEDFDYEKSLFSIIANISPQTIRAIKETNIYQKLSDNIAGQLIFNFKDLHLADFLDKINFEEIDADDILYPIMMEFVDLLRENQQTKPDIEITHIQSQNQSESKQCNGVLKNHQRCSIVLNKTNYTTEDGLPSCHHHSGKTSFKESGSTTNQIVSTGNQCNGVLKNNQRCTIILNKINYTTEDGLPSCHHHSGKVSFKGSSSESSTTCAGFTLKKTPCKKPISRDVNCVDSNGNRTCTQHSVNYSKPN
jgi:hypothetical protein